MNTRRRKKLSARLVAAAGAGDLARVAAVLRAGAPAETADADGTTPLYAAAVAGNAEAAEALLAAGARPDTESGRGHEGTALCAAACWGHEDAVRVLLAHGADPLLREDGGAGLSPLDWAVRESHTGTAALLRAAAGGRGPDGAA
ncbi:ankyrin repeat domain-containing protein [Streptomyces sp. DH37]|uniref:ankyrin repeat domain-containing protein n=1 Tax=Streptomyces sp. DH37 TaxID=3040122 RepID=UPI002441A03F|nr:ankyrin repeat domain-containing protein [Streptomyces sp. DH37]MDG9702103.1 ankyrin repeat domain-containing protein [Streptomyces sp. DH37]